MTKLLLLISLTLLLIAVGYVVWRIVRKPDDENDREWRGWR